MTKQKLLLTMLAALLLLLAACGGAADPVEQTADPAPTNTSAPALDPVEPEDESTDEPDSVDPTAAPEEEAPAAEPTSEETADLPLLPILDAAPSGSSGGLGGGLPQAAGAALPEASSLSVQGDIALTRPFFPNVFSDTTFILNTTLPLEPTSAIVEQQPPRTLDAAQATALAQQFGFNGPLYQELFPDNGVEQPFLPTIFRAFEGSAELTLDPFGVYYSDLEANEALDFANPLPFDQRSAVAESFLQTRGLLNFPYVIQEGFGADVQIMRQLGDYIVEAPAFTVTVNSEGEVAFAYAQSVANFEELGTYPLRTAEEAWQLIQSGVTENNIPFIIMPNADNANDVSIMPIEEPALGEIRFWNREYLPGEEAHLYGWPSIFVPVDGNGAPRINLYPFTVTGDEAQLNGIVEQFGQNMHIWGTVSEDGQTVQVNGWEALEDVSPLSLEGTVVREGETVRLDTIEGDSYLLPNAPEDLVSGVSVYVFAWSVRDTGEQFPVLDWQNIDEAFLVGETAVEEPVEPLIAEPLPGEFVEPSFAEVTINSVTLIYTQMPVFAEPLIGGDAVDPNNFEPPTFVNQPVWEFSGTAESGETVEFFVQAVAPELIGNP